METHFDIPVVVADYIADCGLLDSMVASITRVVTAIPERVTNWLGPELRTPDTSRPPDMTFNDPGPWNGIVFVEANEPTYWLLVRANAGRRANDSYRQPFTSREPGFSGWSPDSAPIRNVWHQEQWPSGEPHSKGDPWWRQR
jgi:hypothetical protein